MKCDMQTVHTGTATKILGPPIGFFHEMSSIFWTAYYFIEKPVMQLDVLHRNISFNYWRNCVSITNQNVA